MTLDPKRVLEVFQSALAVADPALRAAVLDEACGSDADLRKRVEALLKEHEAAPKVVDPSAKTIRNDSPVDPSAITSASVGNTADVEMELPAGALGLDFLQPTTKPGSLGRLGHNEVLEILGRGAFGIVVRAFDEKLQRVVAIKVLFPHLAATSPARKRFLREARASASIRHENVVQIYAVEEQPLPYLVMEYIPGQTLQQRLIEVGPLEPPEILRIGEQIARGLAAAHAQGLIHRDIKPGNILLEGNVEQKVKLTDFGLARACDDASLTQSGVIAGTPLYMAPEQAKGEVLDARADLFSLGSVLYTMACGHPPFRASTPLLVLKRVTEDMPRPIRELVPEAPTWLGELIGRLHAKDPAQRFQSAAEVADLFNRHLLHLQHPSSVALPQASESIARNKQRQAVILLTTVVALAIVGLVLVYRPWSSHEPAIVVTELPNDKTLNAAEPPAIEPARVEQSSSHELQGRSVVRTALIDFSDPDRRFGEEAQDNSIRRAEQCNAFLVHFDLEKLGASPKARVTEAKLSFYVWDPSSSGSTKVCAFAMKTEWDADTVTWRHPATGKSWKDGENFVFDTDTGPASAGVIVKPDQDGIDTMDPPTEYQLDVTDIVREWLDGKSPNRGLAIAPIIDPAADEGFRTRFQVYGSLYGRAKYTPKLTVQMRQ